MWRGACPCDVSPQLPCSLDLTWKSNEYLILKLEVFRETNVAWWIKAKLNFLKLNFWEQGWKKKSTLFKMVMEATYLVFFSFSFFFFDTQSISPLKERGHLSQVHLAGHFQEQTSSFYVWILSNGISISLSRFVSILKQVTCQPGCTKPLFRS